MTAALDSQKVISSRARRWLILGLLFPVIFFPVAISWLGPVPSADWLYVSAVAHVVTSGTPAGRADTPDVGRTQLPESWNRARPGFGGTVEYRISLRAGDAGAAQSLFIPRAKGACDVLFDGALLYAEIGRGEGKSSNRVIFVALPEAARAGGEVLTIRL